MNETNVGASGAIRPFQARWVFGSITDELRRQLVGFWTGEGALDNPDEAWRRSWEVACILQDESTGHIGGVCTVAIGLDEQGRTFGFLRIFIATACRRAGFNVRMMRRVIEGFEALAGEFGAPQRLVAAIENRKIEGRGGRRLLDSVGFTPVGRTPQGELLIERRLSAQKADKR